MTKSLLNDLQVSGYFPGAIGKVTELHATYYHEQWGFDVSFETQVGSELSDFIARFDSRRDGFWAAGIRREFAGAVAIDGRKAQNDGARLRWFVVAPKFQGRGIGRILLEKAVAFCKTAGFPGIYLWTFEGLDAARSLYEGAGFRLTEEHPVRQWGSSIVEQRFDLSLTS
jgi:GNAT superfamily N-acetyltransferase